uniref:RRM domain-containing protein n=1 Tax=Stomoxys calcitrans TaxID=35570 RepID=A0A1I8PQ96_STOCA
MAPVIKQKSKKSPKNKEDDSNEKKTVVSAQLQKKINKKTEKKPDRGVVFIKHLPHGFFEQQLKNYFEQFGAVTRLRLARSRRTGNSKGYAFVEFEYPEVAQVAAETMDNYLMFKKLVKAAYIPPEKQQFNYFKSTVRTVKNKSGKNVWVSSKTASLQRKLKQHNDWSEENFTKRTSKQLKKLKKLGEKCAHLGIDIDKIIIEPKLQTEDDKTAAGSSKSAKRKGEEKAQHETAKKNKKEPKLEDLLGNTIQEDSEDEDYIAVPQGDEEASSDEESYGFLKEADDDEEDDDDDDSDQDENESDIEEESPVKKSKNTKTKFSKSLKASNIERFDQMLKRKPQTGGIQKLSKKQPKPPIATKAKNKMQLSAAKEVAKPLAKVKGKMATNPTKKSKKVK